MSVERYDYLASAIAGRAVTVRRTTRGTLAYSDGRSIFLPVTDGEAGDDAWAAVAAQAALIGAGSLHAAVLGQLIGRPATAQRYLYLEVLRAAQLLAARLPWGLTERAELRRAPLSDSAQHSLELALSRRVLPHPPLYFGRIRALLGVSAVFGDVGSARMRGKRRAEAHTAAASDIDAEAGESSTLLRLLRGPFAGGSPFSDLLKGILGAGISKQPNAGSSGDGGAELRIGRIERAVRRGIHAIRSHRAAQPPDLDGLTGGAAFVYPEWDARAQIYRRDWVCVEEAAAWREDGPQAMGLSLVASAALRRQLSGLGFTHEMHRRQNDGSDLDLDALIEGAIERRAGQSPPSPRVYRTSRRTRGDLAVTLMVDISGSTGEQAPGGESIFQKQLQAAHQLGQVLDSLGATVAMFGFQSWGRHRVRLVRLKGHAERWSSRVAERMALLEPVGYTRIGAAIRHGTQVLRDVIRLPNRLLVLITDGIAYDQDYELTYAAADANRALLEARSAGTACVCLSVGSGIALPQLRDVFGAANLLSVDEVTQLPARIRAVCRDALKSVSSSSSRQASKFSY